MLRCRNCLLTAGKTPLPASRFLPGAWAEEGQLGRGRAPVLCCPHGALSSRGLFCSGCPGRGCTCSRCSTPLGTSHPLEGNSSSSARPVVAGREGGEARGSCVSGRRRRRRRLGCFQGLVSGKAVEIHPVRALSLPGLLVPPSSKCPGRRPETRPRCDLTREGPVHAAPRDVVLIAQPAPLLWSDSRPGPGRRFESGPRARGRRRKPSFVTQCAVAPDLRVGSRGLAEPRAGAGRPPHELQAPGRGGSGPGPLWLRAHPRAAASVLPPAPSGLLAPSSATFSPLPLCPREWPQAPASLPRLGVDLASPVLFVPVALVPHRWTHMRSGWASTRPARV